MGTGDMGDMEGMDLAVLAVRVVPVMDLVVIASMDRTKNKIIETKKNSSPKRAVLLLLRYCYSLIHRLSYIINRLVVFIIQVIQVIHV